MKNLLIYKIFRSYDQYFFITKQKDGKVKKYHVKKIAKKNKKCLQFIFDMLLNTTSKRCGYSSGVERNLAKVDVVGPNPIARSNSTSLLNGGFFNS